MPKKTWSGSDTMGTILSAIADNFTELYNNLSSLANSVYTKTEVDAAVGTAIDELELSTALASKVSTINGTAPDAETGNVQVARHFALGSWDMPGDLEIGSDAGPAVVFRSGTVARLGAGVSDAPGGVGVVVAFTRLRGVETAAIGTVTIPAGQISAVASVSVTVEPGDLVRCSVTQVGEGASPGRNLVASAEQVLSDAA